MSRQGCTTTTIVAASALCALMYVRARNAALSIARVHREQDARLMAPQCIAPVPRIVYVYSDSDNMTTWTRKTMERNPQFDVRVYTPAQARDFVRVHCPTTLSAFDTLIPQSFKADVFRYCALYATGGVYIDDDIEVIEPLLHIADGAGSGKLLLLEDGHDIGWMPPRVVRHKAWTAFLIARGEGSRVMSCAMATVRYHVRSRNVLLGTLEVTGPEVLYDCLGKGADARMIGFNPGRPYAFLWSGKKLLRHHSIPRNSTRYSSGFFLWREWYARL